MGVEENLVEVGRLLRERREELGLRRSDVARRSELTHSYIRTIEDALPRASGHRSRPSEPVLQRWMTALGMGREDRARVFGLVGYVSARASRWASGTAAPATGSDVGLRSKDALINELHVILDDAERIGEFALAEELLRPLFVILRSRFARGAQ